jgi:hypothetical protein
MARTELPWLLLGRMIRPYALAVSVATFALAAVILGGATVWGDDRDVWSVASAALAVAATGLLWVGWWARSNAVMEHGLILSAVVFAIRGTYIGILSGNWWTALLSWAWTIASGGAWLLERTTGAGGGDER